MKTACSLFSILAVVASQIAMAGGIEKNQISDVSTSPDITVGDWLLGATTPMHCMNLGIKDEKSVSKNTPAIGGAGVQRGNVTGTGSLTINGQAVSPFFVSGISTSTADISNFGFHTGTQVSASVTVCWPTTGLTLSPGEVSVEFLYDSNDGYTGQGTL